jgi:hypothetical protein
MIVQRVAAAGGTLDGPYGDTTRPLHPNMKAGASHYSFHYSGRAVDRVVALSVSVEQAGDVLG